MHRTDVRFQQGYASAVCRAAKTYTFDTGAASATSAQPLASTSHTHRPARVTLHPANTCGDCT